MTRVVFLVPRRDDHGPRDRLWRVCRERWERLFPEWPIVEGYHTEGPWNRSAAINEAARLAGDWDVAVVIDADVMVDQRQAAEAVRTAIATGRVTWAHHGWRELTEDATRRILSRPEGAMVPMLDVEPTDVRKETPLSWSCCMAMPREVFDALGGFDERFVGWGGEDTAMAAAIQGLHGWERVEGVVTNLWHPRKPGDGLPGSSPEYVTNMRLRDRYAMALRRDHGLHDRATPAGEAEHRRDMDNIRKSEERNAEKARALGLPDWDDWWPTLEELVARTPPAPTVALLVHSGGSPEAWPERSAYLRASLASLDRLELPKWERRVIVSDWGEERRAELDAIAQEFGLYVVGPDRRLGYAGSMQWMWRYVVRRVRARYVFQTEDDFAIDRTVDVAALARVLDERPKVVQVALLRQAISERERAPGTLLGYPRDTFDGHGTDFGNVMWLEHKHFFTCNPSLMRASLMASEPWPSGPHSEAVYGRRLFGKGRRSALWGSGEQWTTHIGDTRAGGPY